MDFSSCLAGRAPRHAGLMSSPPLVLISKLGLTMTFLLAAQDCNPRGKILKSKLTRNVAY